MTKAEIVKIETLIAVIQDHLKKNTEQLEELKKRIGKDVLDLKTQQAKMLSSNRFFLITISAVLTGAISMFLQ